MSTVPSSRGDRNARAREVRKTTVEPRYLARVVRLNAIPPEELQELERVRPRTRGDCENGIRPCPFVGCEFALYLDVTTKGGVTLNFPDLDFDEIPESCVLDVAERGGLPLHAVADLMNVTRARIGQLELRAKEKVRRRRLTVVQGDFTHPVGRTLP